MAEPSFAFAGLSIESPLVVPSAANFRPIEWPPASDWPVVIASDGKVVSRWGDSVWILDPWAGQRMVLNFGDGLTEKADAIDRINADLLRIVVGWWLYGPGGVAAARTLLTRFSCVRPIFVACSQNNISASEISRFPKVIDGLHEALMPSMADFTLSLLHELYEARDRLGFNFIHREGLARIASAIDDHERRQTPYIPPRIWRYQLSRLQQCLNDFLENQDGIERCFRFCLDAYINNYGSLASALDDGRDGNLRPFISTANGQTPNRRMNFHGRFADTAKRFGIADLLHKWVGDQKGESTDLELSDFPYYLNLVNYAGAAYLMNFSLMRRDEVAGLRHGCLKTETDNRFGMIYLIKGQTTKTVKDDGALWVTCASAKLAVDSLTLISNLRLLCDLNAASYDTPYLIGSQCEPWAGGVKQTDRALRPRIKAYFFVVDSYPRLFDADEMRITKADLNIARLVTPTLSDQFVEGAAWPLAWHQLRRTGAVNMQASGLVSDASLQYQLKHLSRAMSLYYGQNYSRVSLEQSSKTLYVKTMYETLGKELQQLTSDRFVSPHGERRKDEVVRLISIADARKSIELAKSGGVASREIILGVCTNREPCPYGGIDSVAHCGGGDAPSGPKPCSNVLYDRSKADKVHRLQKTLSDRLQVAAMGSPLRLSIEAQMRSVDNYFASIK